VVWIALALHFELALAQAQSVTLSGGGDLWGRLARYQEREAALEGSRDEVGRNPLDQALEAIEVLDE
jgi:hypothetical protein